MAGELNFKIGLDAAQANANVRQFQQGVSETKSKVAEWNRSLEEARANLREIGELVSNAYSRMVESTARVEAHNAALNRLGAAYELVRARTNDAVTAEQAVRVQQQLTQAGYRVTAEQLATITARAREYARANGTDLNQALDQVTETLRSLSGEGLQRYGVQLTNVHTRGDAFRAAIAQMDGQLRRTGTSMQSTAESADLLRRNWQQMQDGIISRIAGWLDLGTAIRGVNDLLDGTFSRMRQANGMTGHDDMAGREAAANRLNAAGARRYFDANSLGRLNTHDAHQVAWYVEHGDIEGARRAMGFGQAQRDEQNARDAAALAGGPQSAAGPSAVERAAYTPSGGGGGGSRTRRSDDVLGASFAGSDAGRSIFGAFGFGAASITQQMAAELELAHAVEESERLKREARQATLDAEKETQRQHAEIREQERANTAKQEAAIRDAAIGRDTLQTQLTERFRQHTELNETRAQGMAGLVEGAYNTMSSAMQTHIAALLQGKETIGEAMRETAKSVALGLATQAIMKAIFETAEGFANLARYAASEGADAGALTASTTHFTSAAIFGLVGAAAGAGYVGLNAIGGGASAGGGAAAASSPGAAASTRGPGGGDSGGSGNTYVINVNGFAMHHEGVQDAVVGAINGFHDRGRTIRGLRYAA